MVWRLGVCRFRVKGHSQDLELRVCGRGLGLKQSFV